jgi:NTP pyrophosphatase (non-canonical NTP hydrolase)
MACSCGVCPECDWARYHPDEDPAFEPVDALSSYDEFVDDFWFLGDADLKMPEDAYLGLCLAGEAGEVAEKLKKAYRDHGSKVDVDDMLKELGDVLYYLVRYAHLLGTDLESVARKNVEKLQDRAVRGKLRGEGDER